MRLRIFLFSCGLLSLSASARELGRHASFFALVSKQANEISLRSFEEPSQVLKTYSVITGKVAGDKQVEGDRKTPEGIYVVTRKLPASRLTALHGSGAFELNYPNPVDRLWKHTGSGIWIHGVDNQERLGKRFDTLGCVAMANEDVLDLGNRLEPGFTPVIIVDAIDAANPAGFLPPTSTLAKRVNDWVKAWSSKDQDAYISFYAPEFRSRQMDVGAWDKYKRRLAKTYKQIEVTLSNMVLLKHPKYSAAFFHQSYRSDRFHSESDKVVYWVGEGEKARIISEVVALENAEIIEGPTASGSPAPAAAMPAVGSTGTSPTAAENSL